MTKKLKQMDLDSQRWAVVSAFEKEYGYYPKYVADVWDTFLIIKDSDKNEYYKSTYTVSFEDEIAIADEDTWVSVRFKKEWLEKSLDIKFRLNINDYILEEGEEEEEEVVVKQVGSPIKELGQHRLGFYGYLWGDSNHKDIHGEWFTEETDGLTELFDQLGAVPFTYHHAADTKIKATVFGMVDTMEPDEVGMWLEVQITNHEKYKEFIKPLVEEDALYPSSETLVGAKKVKKSGEIQRWVTSFMTGTTMPAEWRMMDFPVDEIKSFYKSIGIDVDENILKGIDVNQKKVDDNQETTKEKTQVDTKGAAEARLKALIDIESQKNILLELQIS